MHPLLAEWQLHSWEFRDVFQQFSNVPTQALLLAVVGGLLGWLVAVAVDPLPAEWGILAGMALAIFTGGFSDPQLGVEQPNPSPHCLELAGECVHSELHLEELESR
jgi:hypothetical protein